MNTLLIFGNDNDFSRKNIYKTDKDYKELSNITLQYGENRGIVALSNFHLTDILFIVMLFIITFTFVEESRKGLLFLVRSTVNGRIQLALYRIGSLLLGSLIFCILLYAGNSIAAIISFTDIGFGRAIQSIPEFMHCPYKITIGQYIFLSIIIKCAAGFLVSSLFYLLINIFDTIMSVIGCVFITVFSFFSYLFILPTSSLNILKFANIFTYLKTDDFFKKYYNLNILGSPVDMLIVSVFVLSFALILTIPAAVLSGGFSCQKLSFGFLLPLFLWEGKKILIKQKGIIFIVLCFYLALLAAFDYRYVVFIDNYELTWHNTYDGLISEELIDKIYKTDIELEDKIIKLQDELYEITDRIEIDIKKRFIETIYISFWVLLVHLQGLWQTKKEITWNMP